MPKTAEILKNENVKFVIVGDGRYLDTLTEEIKKYQVKDKFVLVPRQTAETIPTLLASCEAAFISFAKDELWTKTIPAKLQSYMACGMPVIAAAEGETARIIKESGCGVCCDLGNAQQLAQMVTEMMQSDLKLMAENSRRYFDNNFTKQILMNEIDKYLSMERK